MIISKTPYRVSFFGGGTDYPAWYLKEGGAVLSVTVDKYCYISCRYFPPFFNFKHRIVWSHIESVSSISEILHPAVREGLNFLGFDDSQGLEIHHQGDLPARAGMGSSSTFTVGLLNVLTALRGETIGKHELALKAIELEQKVLKEHVGSQDQVSAAYGGFNFIEFMRNGDIRVEPVKVPAQRISELESKLVLVYTGIGRLASEVASKVVENFPNKRASLLKMRQMVDQGLDILQGEGSLDDFGRLLHETWLLKRELSPVISSPMIDKVYKTAVENGAIGGKLLGAGGSGFLVFYVPEESQESLKQAMAPYLQLSFRVDNEGSTLVYDVSNSSEAVVK